MARIPRVILVHLVALVVVALPSATPAQETFVRGDVDGSRSFTVLDAVHTLRFLFDTGTTIPCADAADFDDSGTLDLTDAVSLLNFIFLEGAGPAAPFPLCGTDSTASDLGCASYPLCEVTAGALPLVEDGIFWVVDRSGSMQNSGELDVAKREIIATLARFPEHYQFGIVFFDRGITKFPASGVPAEVTDENVAAATAWTEGVPGGGGSCIQSGLVTALEMARSSTARRKAVIYIGDGGGTCSGANESDYLAQTLDAVVERDTDDTVVHAIAVLEVGQLQSAFLSELAASTGGRYVRVAR